MSAPSLLTLAAAAALALPVSSLAAQPAGERPDSAPPSPPAPAAPAAPAGGQPAQPRPADAFANADELLRALETADQGLETLAADVLYRREFGAIEGGQREEWRGKLYFDADLRPSDRPARAEGAPPRRGFAVLFDTLITERQQREERRAFVFDGRWFVEKLFRERQMIRREVVPPGEVADPLAIGKGPFPLPLGQKREDIVRRFQVELLPAQAGWDDRPLPNLLAGSHQLRLVPREGTDEAREFSEVRLWYQRPASAPGFLLPRMARTVHTDGGTSEVVLANHAPNQPFPEGVFDTAPPPAGSGWNVQTQEFRRGADGFR